MRVLYLLTTFILFGTTLGHAQDLSFITGLFKNVHSVTLAAQGGRLFDRENLSTDNSDCKEFGVCGMSAEVLFDLTAPKGTHLELGLGASYLRGFHEAETSPFQLYGAVRSFPTISVYLTQAGEAHPIQPYAGVNFGISDLWNVQAYDPSGKELSVKGQTFDYGGTAGLYTGFFRSFGLFAEINYRRRRFPSLDWSRDSIPPGAPRELNLDGLLLAFGVQVSLKDEETSRPAYQGTWLLTRVDGQPLPALYEHRDSTPGSIRNEVVSGMLTITEANYDLLLRRRTVIQDDNGRTIVATHPAIPATNITQEGGNYTISKSNDVITLYPSGQMSRAHTLTRNGSELMLRLRDENHILEFKKAGS